MRVHRSRLHAPLTGERHDDKERHFPPTSWQPLCPTPDPSLPADRKDLTWDFSAWPPTRPSSLEPASAPADHSIEKLQELAQPRSQGVLSDEELAAAKAKALGI